MKQTVFVVLPNHPLRKIRQVDCEILVCEKMTWAVEPSGRRHLLGTSGFFTRKAAEVRKLGALRKIADSTVLSRMYQTQYIHEAAQRQLNEYRSTGVVH